MSLVSLMFPVSAPLLLARLSLLCLVRSHALAEAGCVLSLKKLAEDASPATRERVALCFRRLATEPSNRGLIVQQGGLVRLPLTQSYFILQYHSKEQRTIESLRYCLDLEVEFILRDILVSCRGRVSILYGVTML